MKERDKMRFEEQLVCPDCGSECPDAKNYDKECRFNAWSCECKCGLTCLGNTPDEVRATWRNMIIDKYNRLEEKQKVYGI